ncbi:MAG: hypothetical protein ACJA1R_001424 [Flavobacteriales bacterium]|jgi:hypothetical protein
MFRLSLSSFAFALISGLAATALASPWTLPRHAISLSIGGDMQTASEEFRQSSERVSYPVDGSYFSSNLRAGVRYGLSDRTEVSANLVLTYRSFQADEMYFGPVLNPDVGVDPPDNDAQIRANILSIDREAFGIGDIRLALRHRFTPLHATVWAVEIEVKMPTGYPAPEGVFNDDDITAGVADDVTLGDAQTDITTRLLFGAVPARDFFIRADAGFRVRLFGPGHQVVGSFKTGYRIGGALLPYVWSDAEHSVTDGSVIGTTFLFADPDLEAEDATIDDLVGRDITLDHSLVRAGAGAIISFGDRDVDFGYGITVWGKNTGRIHTFSIGTNFAL